MRRSSTSAVAESGWGDDPSSPRSSPTDHAVTTETPTATLPKRPTTQSASHQVPCTPAYNRLASGAVHSTRADPHPNPQRTIKHLELEESGEQSVNLFFREHCSFQSSFCVRPISSWVNYRSSIRLLCPFGYLPLLLLLFLLATFAVTFHSSCTRANLLVCVRFCDCLLAIT